MRGQISDQDLTDYALNELRPEDRLYTESMLAVSEECRHDIYQMIELAQMLEEGFEREDEKASVVLTSGQRSALLQPQRGYAMWQKIAAVLVAAAGAAFTISHQDVQLGTSTRSVATVSADGASVVAEAATVPNRVEFTNPLETLRTMAEDSSQWIQATLENEVRSQAPMVCTPPTLFETVQLAGFGEMNQ